MNNYDFKKLTKEQKWEERNQKWAQNNPEEYVRILIVNDELDLLKQFEKEEVKFDFSYKLKDEILLTLAMEKQAYKTIDYLLNKGLKIKERDIIGLVKNHREEEDKDKFIEILDKINISQYDTNHILLELEDYYYDESIKAFVEYLVESKIQIQKEIWDKFEKYDDLALIFKRVTAQEDFEKMNNKYEAKNIKSKANKI